jgi:hypothetical protein
MTWLNGNYPKIAQEAEEALKKIGLYSDSGDQMGGHPFRSPPTNPDRLDASVDNIVAWIVQSKKGMWGNGKYREIYDEYLKLIDARVTELGRLRDQAPWGQGRLLSSGSMEANRQLRGQFPVEWRFLDWLQAQHSDLWKAIPFEVNRNDDHVADNIVRWLIENRKLGIDSKYNDIFLEYLKLNAARLKEIQRLKSLPPETPPDAAFYEQRFGPPVSVTSPTSTPHLNDGLAPRPQSPPQVVQPLNDSPPPVAAPQRQRWDIDPDEPAVPINIEDQPTGRTYSPPLTRMGYRLEPKTTEDVVRSFYDLLSQIPAPEIAKTNVLIAVRDTIQNMPDYLEVLSIRQLMDLINKQASEKFDLLHAAQLNKSMFDITSESNFRGDGKLNDFDGMRRGDVVRALNNLLKR